MEAKHRSRLANDGAGRTQAREESSGRRSKCINLGGVLGATTAPTDETTPFLPMPIHNPASGVWPTTSYSVQEDLSWPVAVKMSTRWVRTAASQDQGGKRRCPERTWLAMEQLIGILRVIAVSQRRQELNGGFPQLLLFSLA